MERIKALNRYQKGVLIFMLLMALVFAVIYPMTISQVGFEYKDTILVPSQENGSTVYSGQLQGQPARFTVSEDKTVTFHHGDQTYGPYTAREDPAAIPKDADWSEYMTGVELRQGDDILFRGGVLAGGEHYWLYNKDGISNFRISYVTEDGLERDQYGAVIDPAEPSPSTILELMNDPKLTHKGDGAAWFFAVFLCVLNALFILFADELFRWQLTFRIRNADHAQPSDWEVIGRYIGWTAFPLMALALFLAGLQ